MILTALLTPLFHIFLQDPHKHVQKNIQLAFLMGQAWRSPACNLSYLGSRVRRIMVPGWPGQKRETLSEKQKVK
jgi:hypothetical protein